MGDGWVYLETTTVGSGSDFNPYPANAMVPAAYLVIKRRARQKKRHKGAFLGYEADDEDSVEGVSFGRGKAGRTINDKEDKESSDTGKPRKIKEGAGEDNHEWERRGEPGTTRETGEGDMEKKWERSGEAEKTRESEEEKMEEERERTGDKPKKTKEMDDIGKDMNDMVLPGADGDSNDEHRIGEAN